MVRQMDGVVPPLDLRIVGVQPSVSQFDFAVTQVGDEKVDMTCARLLTPKNGYFCLCRPALGCCCVAVGETGGGFFFVSFHRVVS